MLVNKDSDIDIDEEDEIADVLYAAKIWLQHEDYYKGIFGIMDEVVRVLYQRGI